MSLSKFVFAAALAVLPASALQAQYFSTMPAPDQVGASPFWDRVSADNGRGCNIGYVLTGATSGSVCNSYQIDPTFVAPYPTLTGNEWFAHSFGNPDASVGFGFVTGSTGANLKYWGGIAGATPLRQLAVRDLVSGNILHTFSMGAASSFFVAAGTFFDIGIATATPFSGLPNKFSWTSAKPNQFAAFGNGATGAYSADCGDACWVGAEDIAAMNSDYDYNDGVLQITGASSTVVPEPSTYLLMATGLLGLAAAARRRKNNA